MNRQSSQSAQEDDRIARTLADLRHGLCAPMTGIIGALDLLLHTDLTPEQRSYLEIARSSAQDMTNTIATVLSSKHGANQKD